LAIDGLIQGGVDLANGLSIYEYPYFLQFLPLALHPEGRTALAIGVGAGIVPRWYARRGIEVTVVDIDPVVVDMAERHFGPLGAQRTVFADARAFLARDTAHYDYLLVDVFTGDVTPGHLLSGEAVALMAARLSRHGVLAMNLIGSLRRAPYMTASVVRTLREAFEQVEIVPTFDPRRGDGEGNLVLLAYQGALRTYPARLLSEVHPLARDGVARHLAARYAFPAETPALLLSDDFNPLDVRDAWLRERVRSAILQSTDWRLLGG
jgi:spermidine synthase